MWLPLLCWTETLLPPLPRPYSQMLQLRAARRLHRGKNHESKMCKYAYNQRSGLSGSKGRQCYQTAKPPDKCKRSLLFCCNCFIIIFVFFFATQECLNYENLIFAVSLRKTSSVVTLTWNLIRQQMKTRNQNRRKVRTISTLVCCVGVFQWGKAGTYSNLQNRAKFCGTQLNPYYQRGGGEVFDTQKKEGRVWIRELLPPCVNIFSFAYFFASLILNSRWRFEVHTTKEAKNLHRCELQDQHKSSS